jgi:tRNA (guanine37-N1)-methyltransferase
MTASSFEGQPPLLRVGIISLFPELFETFLATSLVGKAVSSALVDVQLFQLREHGLGNHRSVDDTPYGGGSGMVLRVDCVVSAIEAAERALGAAAHRVLLTPQGQPFAASAARKLAQRGCILLICGRYEGFDERVRGYVHEEISLGDFVLTGGEIPAMAVIEAAIRFLPGVLGNQASTSEESFSEVMAGKLEYPQYTRPIEFRGARVPEILTSGDHAKIAAYRSEESTARTRTRRPDLCEDD